MQSRPESQSTHAPRHVAIIMDGNGRWAKARHLPRAAGHKKGVDALNRVVETAARAGVGNLTVFAFSSENWKRPQAEVDTLMRLFAEGLLLWEKPLTDAGIRLRVIGERSAFPEDVQSAIAHAEAATAAGTGMVLNIAANYGGRWDMTESAKKCVAEGVALTPENIAGRVALADAGEVDLLIRTGGEQRISNFLLWQSAYAEIYFTDELWPDFGGEGLLEAFAWFAGRERRFGMTSEQIRGRSVVF